MKRTPRRLIGTAMAVAAFVALPASAEAITVSGTAAPVNKAAGAHSDFKIHMDFSGGQVKNLTVGLPPGMIGNPNAAPKCTATQLNGDNCPANTEVGTVSADASVTVVIVPVPVTVNGTLYNLVPKAGEPARFGIVLRPLDLGGLVPSILPPIVLQSAVQLRPDFGLNTVIKNIPNSTQGLPTTINSQDITLFGIAPGTGKAFMRNPTSCTLKRTTFTAVPYSGASGSAQSAFTPTNCGALDFSPSFTARVGGAGQTASGLPTTASTSIDQDADEAGLIRAQVSVPNDFNANAALLSAPCPAASFTAGSCPPGSVVGSAVAASPLLSQPLTGPVALVASSSGLPNLGLDLRGQLHLLLQGSIDITKVVTFNGLPDIPIAHFQLSFPAPPGFLGNTRDLCAPPVPIFHADFAGYNGATTAVDAPATVDGCGAGANLAKKKCKKAKKHKHKKKHRAAESKKKKHKKHKKKRCKKKKKHHKKKKKR
jgi:hypothetical protein